jgi:hypothetical protein
VLLTFSVYYLRISGVDWNSEYSPSNSQVEAKTVKLKPYPKKPPKVLSEEDVQVVRRLSELGHVQADISAFFGVSQQLVSAIANRTKRKNVPDNADVDVTRFLEREPTLTPDEILSLLGVVQPEPAVRFRRRA